MIRPAGWTLVAAAAGYFAGDLARERDPGPVEPAPEMIATAEHPGTARQDADVGAEQKTATLLAGAVTLKSHDTLADLLAVTDDYELYPRLALWLLDAGEADMAAFWDGYRKRSDRNSWTVDLIFSQWTRLNPADAIEAAKGSGHEGIPWWAWAINDPDAAVAAARNAPAGMAGFVMRSVGQFHPARALKFLEDNPDFAQWNAVEGIVEGIGRDDPEAALDFLRGYDQRQNTNPIETWTRRDPEGALEWLRQNPRIADGTQEDAFLRTMEYEHPEMLAGLAESMPPGALKRKLEAAAFRELVKDNPQQALAAARATEAPRLAAERFTEIGRGMVADDPRGAMGMLAELFKTYPDATNGGVSTGFPVGSRRSQGGVAGVHEFMQELVAIDPQAAMEAVTGAGEKNGSEPGLAKAAALVGNGWITRDFDGYSNWIQAQQDGPLRNGGAAVIATHLVASAKYDEAMDWAAQVSDPAQAMSVLGQTFQPWLFNDVGAASAWLEQAQLSDQSRKYLRQFLPSR